MEYVCLAAGKGTRFGALGRYLQKCMYPVGLEPFLAYSVRNLLKSRRFDVRRDRLILVVGHFAEQVWNFFGERFEGVEICYLEQPNPLGTGHALSLVFEAYRPAQPVIAWLADLYVPTALFERVCDHEGENVLTLASGAGDEKVQVTTEGDQVVRAWRGEGDFDIGLWKLSPETLARMARVREGEYRVLPNLQGAIEEGVLVGYVRANEWLHLGGTHPTVEANVRAVVERVLGLHE